MTPSIERRAIAFIRTIANRCERCLRRSEEKCRGCVSSWANSIMSDYERDTAHGHPAHDYSLAARKFRIIDILQKAGRPLLASEIDLSGLCSRGLKQWTLRRMTRSGQIVRVLNEAPDDERHIYLYALPRKRASGAVHKKTSQSKEQTNGNRNRKDADGKNRPATGDTQSPGGNAAAEEEQHGDHSLQVRQRI